MENLIKGWVTSTIGFIILIVTILHFFGFVTFPKPTALDNNWACGISILFSYAFFSFGKSEIDDYVRKGIVSVWERVFGKPKE